MAAPCRVTQSSTRPAKTDLAREVAELATEGLRFRGRTPSAARAATGSRSIWPRRRHHTHGQQERGIGVARWARHLGTALMGEARPCRESSSSPTPPSAGSCAISGLRTVVSESLETGAGHPAIYYATSSRRLAVDVQALLLRLGVQARLEIHPQTGKGRDQYHVRLSGRSQVLRFAEAVGAVGAYKNASLDEAVGLSRFSSGEHEPRRHSADSLESARPPRDAEERHHASPAPCRDRDCLCRVDDLQAEPQPGTSLAGRSRGGRGGPPASGRERHLLGSDRFDRRGRRGGGLRPDRPRPSQLRGGRSLRPQLDRAGRRHGGLHLPRRGLQPDRGEQGAGGADHRQAPKRRDRHRRPRLPGRDHQLPEPRSAWLESSAPF